MATRERLAGATVVAVRPDADASWRVLRELLTAPLEERAELVAVQGPRPGSGRHDGEFWERGPWFLKTRSSRVWPEAPAGVAALDRLDRLKRALHELTPAKSLLALVREDRGAPAFQLWTIAPRLVTLREHLDGAWARRDWTAFTRGLVGFAHGLGESLRLSLDQGWALDTNPGNFALQGARIRYIDDDVLVSTSALGIEDAFLARFGEYADVPLAAWTAYVERFAAELASVATPRLVEVGLVGRLRAAARLRPAFAAWAERVIAGLELS